MIRYPIYIPSRGRADVCLTAKCLTKESIPFHVVVEPHEQALYQNHVGHHAVLSMPKSRQGIAYVRNWIKRHSAQKGEKRHWQIDDNIRCFNSADGGSVRSCSALTALSESETLVDFYANVGIAGLRHAMFSRRQREPFSVNQQVYSCVLVLNSIDIWWRERTIEDTDYSLQVLSRGWCTLLINRFSIAKQPTLKMKGGNTDTEYSGDGRAIRTRGLMRLWPHLIGLKRGFGLPKPSTAHLWKHFTTRLKPASQHATESRRSPPTA